MGDATKENLKELMRALVRFMEGASSSYDNEFTGEAQRLAVCIRAVAEDTGFSRSLLERLKLKSLLFCDNSPDYDPSIGLPFSGLAVVTIGGPVSRYTPRLGKNPRIRSAMVPFDEWWRKTEIVDEEKGLDLTREGIVIAVSNTQANDVDPSLNDSYNKILLKTAIGWVDEHEATHADMIMIEFASVRQIAYELLKSLKEQAPEYFT
ncbi:MAG: hypothetical protein HYV24_02645 [Deltaproteobacteria bacterium]|nr:hypothetical protein [Deltaproteobacteria bacterium]